MVRQLAEMAKFMGWAHDFWTRMGVREYEAWRAAVQALAHGQPATDDPDTWKGTDRNPRWQQLRQSHLARTGRG